MDQLFPAFNEQEAFVTSGLTARELDVMTRALRKVVLRLEEIDPAGAPLVPVAATPEGGSADALSR